MKYETYMLQNVGELNDLLKLFRAENVKSYLEVGCKFGGSLWWIANRLPKGSKIVAVDLPHGDGSFKNTKESLLDCVATLKAKGYDATCIIGDSTDHKVVNQAKALGPFDACFLDGNHTLPYIQKDWENYGPMARLMCFHDIGFFRKGGLPPEKKPIEVPIFWEQIKNGYKFKEIRRDPQDNGIGIIWR